MIMFRLPEIIKEYIRLVKIVFRHNRNPIFLLQLIRRNSILIILDKINIYPKVVVDIGANRGNWTKEISVFLSKGTKYYLAEPNNNCFNYLVNEYNYKNNIHIHNFAISSENKTRSFNYSNSDDLSSLESLNIDIQKDIIDRDIYYTKTEDVQCITLDHYFKKYIDDNEIDLLKIDVQGHEISLLSGGINVLSKVKFILIEWNIENIYNSESNFVNVHNLLVENNFSLFYIFNQYIENKKLVYADALYFNKGS